MQAVLDELMSTENPVPRLARACLSAACARTAGHLGQPARAMALLALPIQALSRAPAWALNYTRVASDTAETLWLLDRRDHQRSVEAALRLEALPADFRFPMMDLRLSLARLCAVDGRVEEAAQWFGQARSALEEQGARPLRATTDFDQALMHARLGRRASARPLLEASSQPVPADRHDRVAAAGGAARRHGVLARPAATETWHWSRKGPGLRTSVQWTAVWYAQLVGSSASRRRISRTASA